MTTKDSSPRLVVLEPPQRDDRYLSVALEQPPPAQAPPRLAPLLWSAAALTPSSSTNSTPFPSCTTMATTTQPGLHCPGNQLPYQLWHIFLTLYLYFN